MSAEERIGHEDKLTKGLKESFEKMLLRKRQLGQSVVTCDENGNVITLTAEDAWNYYKERNRMSEKEYKSYRFNNETEPTDEQLAELMHRAGDEVRRTNAEANAKFFDSLRHACEEAGKRADSISL